jgi:hypothetical protein
MKTKLLYAILAILTGLSYWSVRPTVIAQEPPNTPIVVSNLTLNLLLFALLVGASAPWITKRLFPGHFKLMLVPTALVMGAALILVLRAFGVAMRF